MSEPTPDIAPPPRLAFSEEGAGEPVVLVHSGGFTSRQWRRLREALAATHRVIAPDLLGYGATGPWPRGAPFHFHMDVRALGALLDDLGEPAHLVGHSYGGLLALHGALARPVRSLALYEPVAFSVLDPVADAEERRALAALPLLYEGDERGADDRWLAGFVEWWNGPGAWAAMSREAQEGFRAVGEKLFAEVVTLTSDDTPLSRYGTLGAPALLLGGARTPAVERRVLERLAAALPRARLQLIEGAGHMGPITHAAQVNEAICAHVRGATAGAAG